ncbi:MAG: hypothetical protein ABFE13_24325 [Phycisphaerales bacterium]
MIVKKLIPENLLRSQTLRAITCGVLISVAIILISQLLGFPAHPGVAGALGAIAGASCLAGRQRK